MGKKVVAFIGSPHSNGNVATAVNEIINGCKLNGSECIVYDLNKMNIGYCKGCFACKKNSGKCVINDDIQEIVKQVSDADAVIMGSPIYICQVSAQMKTLMDRFYSLTDEKHNPYYGNKKLIMVYTYGVPIPLVFNRYITYNGPTLKYMGLKLYKNVVIKGCYTKDKVKNDLKLLTKLNKLGRKVSM